MRDRVVVVEIRGEMRDVIRDGSRVVIVNYKNTV